MAGDADLHTSKNSSLKNGASFPTLELDKIEEEKRYNWSV